MNKIILLLISMCVASCSVQHSVSLQPENPEDIQVMLTSFPEQSYREIALVESRGSDGMPKSYYINKLKKRARKYKPDALIGIRFDYAADGSVYASAVAIKYD